MNMNEINEIKDTAMTKTTSSDDMATKATPPLIDAAQLQKDLAFSDTDLTSAMMSQAGMFAHYAVKSAKALGDVERTRMIRDIVESKADKAIRDEAVEAGEKITENKIHAALGLRKDVVGARKAVHESKMMADLAKNALEAFKMRRDMLVQVGVAQREELKGETRVAMDRAERLSRRESIEATLAAGSESETTEETQTA